MAFEECCDTFAVAVKSSEMQHAQPVPTLANPRLRPERKTGLQGKCVITYRCHDCFVVEEPDTWVKAEGANSCEKVRAISFEIKQGQCQFQAKRSFWRDSTHAASISSVFRW